MSKVETICPRWKCYSQGWKSYSQGKEILYLGKKSYIQERYPIYAEVGENKLYLGEKSYIQVGETYIQGRNTISGEGNPIVRGENLYMEGHILYPGKKSYIQERNPILGERKSYIQGRNTMYRWGKSIYAGVFPIFRGETLYSGKKILHTGGRNLYPS